MRKNDRRKLLAEIRKKRIDAMRKRIKDRNKREKERKEKKRENKREIKERQKKIAIRTKKIRKQKEMRRQKKMKEMREIKRENAPRILIGKRKLKLWSENIEIKYWEKTGIEKGTEIYDRYWEAFSLSDYSFSDKKIIEVGCGPFGGIFYNHSMYDVSLVDFCSKQFNEMGYSKRKIVFGNLSYKLPFADNTFHYAVCTNTIDHTMDVKRSFKELSRVLRINGILFLHVHIRTEEELSHGHIHILTPDLVKVYVESVGFVSIEWTQQEDWVNENKKRQALFLVLEKLN